VVGGTGTYAVVVVVAAVVVVAPVVVVVAAVVVVVGAVVVVVVGAIVVVVAHVVVVVWYVVVVGGIVVVVGLQPSTKCSVADAVESTEPLPGFQIVNVTVPVVGVEPLALQICCTPEFLVVS
jgi:hypothetical protein